MKITRKQLKKIILKEFDMSGMMDNDIDDLLGTGGQPPTKPPEHGRGGGGRGPKKNPCEFGMPRFEKSYDIVFETFAVWVQNNEKFGGPNGKDNFQNYFDYLVSLGFADADEGIFDVIKGMMDVFATYYCATRLAEFPPTIETVYNNPKAAIDYYWKNNE
jgi:hypothetical protein|tara:strand:- start:1991 stop:2470 length:480 start_codon:yes stop_codon:yes gene_type:complete